MFSSAYPETLPVPYVYPTPDGGISLEWDVAEHDISMEISPEREGWYHRLNLETGEEDEEHFNLNTAEGWRALFERIETLRNE